MKRNVVKFSLAIIGIFLGAAVALYLIGGRTAVYRADIEINDAPEVVFNYLTETELLLAWMDGVTNIEPLTEGEHRVGAKARVTVEENGSKIVLTDEVLQSEAGKFLQISLTSAGFSAISTYDLHSHGDATHLSHELRANYGGMLRIFAPFVAGSVKQKLDDDFRRLKELIESRRQDPAETDSPEALEDSAAE